MAGTSPAMTALEIVEAPALQTHPQICESLNASELHLLRLEKIRAA
jgi:hypothetical protein